MSGKRGARRIRRDYTKPHRLFVEDTPRELRAILEEAAGAAPKPFRKQTQVPPADHLAAASPLRRQRPSARAPLPPP